MTVLSNAQIIMATAQAFHEEKIPLHEVWCSRELKVVYTWIDESGADQTEWFFFNRNVSYTEMVEAIRDSVNSQILIIQENE